MLSEIKVGRNEQHHKGAVGMENGVLYSPWGGRAIAFFFYKGLKGLWAEPCQGETSMQKKLECRNKLEKCLNWEETWGAEVHRVQNIDLSYSKRMQFIFSALVAERNLLKINLLKIKLKIC